MIKIWVLCFNFITASPNFDLLKYNKSLDMWIKYTHKLKCIEIGPRVWGVEYYLTDRHNSKTTLQNGLKTDTVFFRGLQNGYIVFIDPSHNTLYITYVWEKQIYKRTRFSYLFYNRTNIWTSKVPQYIYGWKHTKFHFISRTKHELMDRRAKQHFPPLLLHYFYYYYCFIIIIITANQEKNTGANYWTYYIA